MTIPNRERFSFFTNKNTRQSFSRKSSLDVSFSSGSFSRKEDKEDKENVSFSSLINTRGRIFSKNFDVFWTAAGNLREKICEISNVC